MSSDSFKNVIRKMFTYNVYLMCKSEQDLALNNFAMSDMT